MTAERAGRRAAILALEDGRVFRGRRLGAEGEAYGEVVFNTAMTGYQEILSDPSYAGQIVVLTYPLIGNYGVRAAFLESRGVFAEALVVREAAEFPQPWRSEGRLAELLEERGVVAIEGVDTRALTRHIRERGELRAVLSSADLDAERLVRKARDSPGLVGRNLVAEVTCAAPYRFAESADGGEAEAPAPDPRSPPAPGARGRVVVYDFGVKRGILRALAGRGLEVVVVPAATAPDEALRYGPVGVVLSNGPGDPAAVPEARAAAAGLIGRLPVLGICLGHQLAGLALGARTRKLKFGHHGANHPVVETGTRRVLVTSQNHGFVVEPEGLARDLEVTHLSLNDGTLEGFADERRELLCVQFHPEASPGPNDAVHLFDRFARMCGVTAGPPAELAGPTAEPAAPPAEIAAGAGAGRTPGRTGSG